MTNFRRFEWLMSHVDYAGDDCLIWPYARDLNGYGKVHAYGKGALVSRVMCQAVHGPAPEGKPEAAHTCGKGHLGCFNPKHLVWKSRADNIRDRAIHGTDNKGERHPAASLSETAIVAIRSRTTERGIDLAKEFGVCPSTITKIRKNKRWSHIGKDAA